MKMEVQDVLKHPIHLNPKRKAPDIKDGSAGLFRKIYISHLQG